MEGRRRTHERNKEKRPPGVTNYGVVWLVPLREWSSSMDSTPSCDSWGMLFLWCFVFQTVVCFFFIQRSQDAVRSMEVVGVPERHIHWMGSKHHPLVCDSWIMALH